MGRRPNENGLDGPPEHWTWWWVRDVMTGAWAAVLATPLDRSRDIPSEGGAIWPAVMPERFDYPSETGPTRVRPDSEQLALADQVLPWILRIHPERDRKVIAGRLCGVRWSRLAAYDGRCSAYLRGELWRKTMERLAAELQAQEKSRPTDFTNLTKFGSSGTSFG